MVTICCFSSSDCKKTLIMTYLCSNDSVSRIKLTTLFNAHDLAHCYDRAVFPFIKKRYYFSYGGSLQPFLWVVLLCWHCSESELNRAWDPVAVAQWLFSLGVSNYWASSTKSILLFNMFVLRGMDTGWVWTISSVVSCTVEFVLEYVPVDSYSLLDISTFHRTYHDYVNWTKLNLKDHWWQQVTACFLPSLCDWPIALALLDE